MRRGAALNVLLAAVSTAAALLLVEGLLRVFFPIHPTVFRPDAELLHAYVPGSRKIFQRRPGNGGELIEVRINSRGFRDREFETRPGRPRIMVYGDSYVAAEYTRLENTFPKRLEAHLSEAMSWKAGVPGRPPPLEVLNAGVTGYGPGQICVRLERDLPRFSPDLVIVGIYAGNDFGELMRNKLFRPGQDGMPLRNAAVLKPRLREEMLRAGRLQGRERLQIIRRWNRFLQRTRYAALDVKPYLEAYLPRSVGESEREYRRFVTEGDDTVTNLFHDHYEADIALRPMAASSRYKAELMEQVIARLDSMTKVRSVPLVLLLIPSPLDACREYDIRIDAAAHPQYRPSRLTDLLEAACRRREVAFLNLYEAFGAPQACQYYFRHGNDHWNDAGQDRAALLMADYLPARGLLSTPRRAPPGPAVRRRDFPPAAPESHPGKYPPPPLGCSSGGTHAPCGPAHPAGRPRPPA